MPEITGSVAIDVAIGLAFIYFVLSLVCSAINELLASLRNWRAKNLEKGIRSLLGEAGKNSFYGQKRVKVLKEKESRNPSYISARTFALTVFDTIAPDIAEEEKKQAEAEKAKAEAEKANGKKKKKKAKTAPSHDVLEPARKAVAKMDDSEVKELLGRAVASARTDIDEVRKALETEFDEVMDRVSGWYKRKVQYVLFAIAIVVAFAANADSFTMGSRLAKEEAVRNAVVAQAIAATEADEVTVPTVDDDGDPIEESEAALQVVGERVAHVEALNLPIGWSSENVPEIDDLGSGIVGVLSKLGGLLITAFALSLGAPFWFDALGKLAHLRSTGNREGTEKNDDRAAVDRDER